MRLEKLGPPRSEVIYQINCQSHQGEGGLYLDPPWIVESGPALAHLRGSQAIDNLELHLERNKEITFIVYREFECCGRPGPARRDPSPQISSLKSTSPSSRRSCSRL